MRLPALTVPGRGRTAAPPASPPRTAVVLGASLAGLFAAAACASAGLEVTLVERDDLPADVAPRAGVPQGRQPHIFLHRGLLALSDLLPGIREDLVAAGGVVFDTGDLPWLGKLGWSPLGVPQYEVVSCTRPLLEHVVRGRVLEQPGVRVVAPARATGLVRAGRGLAVTTADGSSSHAADLVVDATGRTSRLPEWLPALGIPAPRTFALDARIGYASRRYAARPGSFAYPGLVLTPTPDRPVGGMALPVEDGEVLVLAVGYGDRRPPRDEEGFLAFLASLRDDGLAALVRGWEPVSDIAVHRQTGNVRHYYDELAEWPDSLVVVGDAFCCFNPVYGQGISVAAMGANALRAALGGDLAPGWCRRLQKDLAGVTTLPWGICTSEDLTYPSAPGDPSRADRVFSWWVDQVSLLALHGDERAAATLGGVYHLMAPPSRLLHPALVGSAATRRLRRTGPPAKRPDQLPSL